MGKWDRRNYARPRRRYYKDYDWSPPRDEPCPDPETEEWQDNVPMWEKKFCYLVGRMPWKKVLSTRNFMHGQSNVLSWDDSAGEEAFNNAKKRFWEEINGLPCETQLPNPDMYIDEINWNPSIDPELVRESDEAYFNPDDKYNLPYACSTRGNNELSGDAGDQDHCSPKNCIAKDKTTGLNPWEGSVDDTNKLTKSNDPWEGHHNQENENVKDNAWGGSWNKSWDSKQNIDFDKSNNWPGTSNTWRNEGTGSRDHGFCSRNWNSNKRESFKSNNLNKSYRTQEFGCQQESSVRDGRDNPWGQLRKDASNWEVKDSGNVDRGQGWYSTSYRKREGPEHHAVKYKGPRLQGSDVHSKSYWHENNNKRVSYGRQWS